jgi:signal peptidase I
MSGAGRGVTPGAEPDVGSDREPGFPALDQPPAVNPPAVDPSAVDPPVVDPPIVDADRGAAGRPAGEAPVTAEDSAGETGAPGDARAAAGPDAETSAGSASGDAGAESSAGTPGRKTPARGSRTGRFFRELVILIVVALVIAVAIKTYAVQAFFIPSGSMENTLLINDRVLVNKIVYDTRSIHRGDIVVFNGDGSWDPGSPPASENFVEKFGSGFASMFGFGHPGDILIKRVIGLPGDKVACCDAQGRVTVNGIPLNEQSYLYPGAAPSQDRFEIVVSPGRLWVMGDNRAISADSRDHLGDPGGGTIPESAVIGRAFVIIWPLDRWRILPIPATFEQPKLNESSAATPTRSTAASTTGASTAGDASTTVLASTRLEPSNPALPLVLGFAVALPISWLQRRIRIRAVRSRAARKRPVRKRPARMYAARMHTARIRTAERRPADLSTASRIAPETAAESASDAP